MYKFLGKKGQLYKFDPYEFIMKLNFNCPKSYKDGEGEGSCKGYKPGNSEKATSSNSKKNRKKIVDNTTSISELQAKLKSLEKDSSHGITKIHELDGTTIDVNSAIKQVRKQIENLNKSPSILNSEQVIKKTKSIINKVKKEKSTGKVSKETIQELKTAITDTKKILETPVSPNTKITNTRSYKSPIYKDLVTNTTKLIYSNEKYKNAMMDYTTDSSPINSKLISRSALSSDMKEKVKNLDSLIENSTIPDDMIVHSGISKELYDKLVKSTNKTFKTNAFISTSANKKVAEGFAQYRNKSKEPGYMLEIRMRKGSHAIATTDFVKENFKNSEYVVGEDGKFFSGGSQHEVILPRNVNFKIIETIDETVPNKNYPTTDYLIKKIVVEIG